MMPGAHLGEAFQIPFFLSVIIFFTFVMLYYVVSHNRFYVLEDILSFFYLFLFPISCLTQFPGV